ncbi:MAG: DUF4126 domain-containing protein [Flavobacteriales bacterium]|nr:DUF4126 domain-containing protein [Flavobacteriales bacterium]
MGTVLDVVWPIALGVGLAAACGLRVFLPLFFTSVLAHFNVGDVGLREGFGWLAEWPALLALGVATVAEAAAYYIPVMDHALDVIAVPLSTVAGTLVAMSTFVDLPPALSWGLALVAGGGVAGLVSAGTAAARLGSSLKTAGLGNPVVATAETGGAIGLSLLAWFIPLLALVLVLILLVAVLRRVTRRARS